MLSDVLLICGLACVVVGAYMYSVLVGTVTLGCVLVLAAVLTGRKNASD